MKFEVIVIMDVFDFDERIEANLIIQSNTKLLNLTYLRKGYLHKRNFFDLIGLETLLNDIDLENIINNEKGSFTDLKAKFYELLKETREEIDTNNRNINGDKTEVNCLNNLLNQATKLNHYKASDKSQAH